MQNQSFHPDNQMQTSQVQSISPHSTVDNADDQKITEDVASLSSTEDFERRRFNQDVHRFMTEIGKPLTKIPIMGYKELDLYQLFKEVISYGGFHEVVKNVGTWSKIWKRLSNFDPSITDSSFRLKKNYERYLLEYELHCFPDHRKQIQEYQERAQLKRSNSQTNLLRPHSPVNSTSSTTLTTTIPPVSSNTNPSSPVPHNSPESFKPKHKKSLSKGRKTVNSLRASQSKLPVIVDDLTIESLGHIVPRSEFVTEKHIFPVGFISTRTYTSMKNTDTRTRYTSEIVEFNGRPKFIVTAADDPLNPIAADTPSEAWKIVLQSLLPKEQSNAKISVCGGLRFGLSHPTVSQLIRELPHAEKCIEIQLQYSPSSRKRKSYPPSESDDISLDGKSKILRNEDSMDVSSGDEMDIESAVATLHALKYCTVY